MIGRAPSSAKFRSISHTSCLRLSWSASLDCWSISLSTSGFAVTIIVQLGAAPIKQVEVLVGVGPASCSSEGDDIVLAHDPGKPVCGVDCFELAVDVDLLQLVDQDHRRIPQVWEVAHRHLDLEPVIGPITELMHGLASVRAV